MQMTRLLPGGRGLWAHVRASLAHREESAMPGGRGTPGRWAALPHDPGQRARGRSAFRSGNSRPLTREALQPLPRAHVLWEPAHSAAAHRPRGPRFTTARRAPGPPTHPRARRPGGPGRGPQAVAVSVSSRARVSTATEAPEGRTAATHPGTGIASGPCPCPSACSDPPPSWGSALCKSRARVKAANAGRSRAQST